MGVLQRFERRLEGLVEGGFARVFRSHVQPVEVAAALQREAADKKAVVAAGRVLVPNGYVVELAPGDVERIGAYDAALRRELAAMVAEHAKEQGWSFVGPVEVQFEQVDDLDTGVFRVRSTVAPDAAPSAPVPTAGPRLEVGGRTYPLSKPVTVVGRGQEADVRLPDTGVSRAHLELRLDGEPGQWTVHLVDLRSTNGTELNGRKVSNALLADGDRLVVGTTDLVFRDG